MHRKCGDQESRIDLIEVVTPRTNSATVSPVAHLLDAIAGRDPVSLEIVGTSQGRAFLVRARAGAMRGLARQLGAAYPQAELRERDITGIPDRDPARLREGEVVASCGLLLRAPAYLPLRTFEDADVAADRAPQADPIVGILGAMGHLPEGWRAVTQIVLHSAPRNWADGYQRMALEHPLHVERAADASGGPSLASIYLMGGTVTVFAAVLMGQQWYAEGDYAHLALLTGGIVGGVPGSIWLKRKMGRRPLYDPLLVREKLSHSAYLAQIRLAVFAPTDADIEEMIERVNQLAAAYHQFSLPAGNGLEQHVLHLQGHEMATLRALPVRRRLGMLHALPGTPAVALLNSRELAGLWHLPQALSDVPLLERTTARRWAPLPGSVAHGCRIGVSEDHGQRIPVSLSQDLLRRHLLLVAKTRRGKSTLLLRLASEMMSGSGGGTLVLVDPHRDLARATLGMVPAERHQDVVYLDASNQEHPFGLNLVDTGLGWDRDMAVASTLTIFEHEFEHFWGPRMEDIFRFVLLTLYAANETLCASSPEGRERQYTILQIPALLIDPAFRRYVLSLVPDAIVHEWWSTHYERALDKRLQLESINPVLSKINRFAASAATRLVVGQARSTVDPAAWLRDGKIVVVNTAKGDVGESTAGIIGATVLNLIALHVGGQARVDPEARRRVAVIVDEFHTMAGADYESFLAELSKVGASLILATQTLARLDVLDRTHGRALRSTLFANIDGLFAFHCSAEDATYLVPELGSEIDVQDLVALGEHRCYARLSAGRERLPLFSIHLDPPPVPDASLIEQLSATSAQRYGRPRTDVEAGIAAAFSRIAESHQSQVEQARADARTVIETGKPGGTSHDGQERRSHRNHHRGGKAPRADAEQPRLDDGPDEAASDEERDTVDLLAEATSA